MATHIRLKRVGAKKEASYRIIVTDSREGTSGAAIERLGLYNPRTQPSLVRLDAARTLYWLNAGATPSDTVRSILQRTGVWKQFHDGVEVTSLEEATIVLGPPEGQRGTSQRPAPEDREDTQDVAPVAKPKSDVSSEKQEAAPAGEAPAAEEAPAEEAEVEAPAAEAEPAEAAESEAVESEAAEATEEAPADEAPEEVEAEAETEEASEDAPAAAEASAEEAEDEAPEDDGEADEDTKK